MKNVFLILILSLLAHSSSGQSWKEFRYENGDLLFQDLDCGGLCDAIEAVTPGIETKRFSHIGMIYNVGDSTYVVEALGKDVHLTPLATFIHRQLNAGNNPKVIVGRLKSAYRKLNSRALGFALTQVGKPYDEEFKYDNGKYYCSELIYDAYKEANDGIPFFHLYPMTFKDPATGKTHSAWRSYFKGLRKKIPEGQVGCNPGSIAVSGAVEIVQSFY